MSNRERKKRQSRRLWVQAAKTCFARDGYNGTSVDRVAQEAGLSRPGFFLYFSSKAALRTAIRLELLQSLMTVLDQELSRSGELYAQRERGLQRVHRLLEEEQALVLSVGLLGAGLSDDDEPANAAWQRLARRLVLSDPEVTDVLRINGVAGLLRSAWQVLLGHEANEAEVRAFLLEALQLAPLTAYR